MAESLDIWNLDIKEEDIIECCVAEDGTIYTVDKHQKIKYDDNHVISYGNKITNHNYNDEIINIPKYSKFNNDNLYYRFNLTNDNLKIITSCCDYSLDDNDEYLNVNTMSVYEEIKWIKTTYINISNISTIEFTINYYKSDIFNIVINDKIYHHISKDVFEKFKAEYEAYISRSKF